MRKARFSEYGGVMREAGRDPVSAVVKRHAISEQTDLHMPQGVRRLSAERRSRLKQLQAEHARLKKFRRRASSQDRDDEESRRNKLVSEPARGEGLAIDVDGRFRSARVIGVRYRLASAGVPMFLRGVSS
jgi:hypothetical protein